MGSVRNMIIFTVVIIVIIITVENSNANDCLKKITSLGGIKEDCNGKEAFRFIYLYINTNSRDFNCHSKIILHEYFDYLFNEAISAYKDGILPDPSAWCLSIIETEFKRSKCHDYMKKYGFTSDAKSALKNGYYNITFTRNINGMVNSYYSYILNEFLEFHDLSFVQGPKEYCENKAEHYFAQESKDYSESITVRYCIDQIIGVGKFNKSCDGAESLVFAYFNLTLNSVKGKNKDILYQYFEYLYSKLNNIYADGMFQNPVDWCGKYKTTKPNDKKENVCKEYLRRVGFYDTHDSRAALKNAFNNLSKSKRMSIVAKEYYKYIFENLKPYIDFADALGPIQYCNSLKSLSKYLFRNEQGNTVENQFSTDHGLPTYFSAQDTEENYWNYNFTSESTSSVGETNHLISHQPNLDQIQQINALTNPEYIPNANYLPFQSTLSTFPPDYRGVQNTNHILNDNNLTFPSASSSFAPDNDNFYYLYYDQR